MNCNINTTRYMFSHTGIIVGAAQYIIFHILLLYIAYFIVMPEDPQDIIIKKLNEMHRVKTQCSEPNADNLLASIPIQVAKQLGKQTDLEDESLAKPSRFKETFKQISETISKFFEELASSLKSDPKAKTNEDIETETLLGATSVAINSAIQLNGTAYDLSNNVFNYFDVFIFVIFVFLLALYYMIQIFIPSNNPYHTIVYNQLLGLIMIPVLFIVIYFKKKMNLIERMYKYVSGTKTDS